MGHGRTRIQVHPAGPVAGETARTARAEGQGPTGRAQQREGSDPDADVMVSNGEEPTQLLVGEGSVNSESKKVRGVRQISDGPGLRCSQFDMSSMRQG
jgi:hypothetical protein